MGWRLLMNEHVMIQHEGQQIAVAGVENWSASDRFPKYGKLDTALHGIDPNTPCPAVVSRPISLGGRGSGSPCLYHGHIQWSYTWYAIRI